MHISSQAMQFVDFSVSQTFLFHRPLFTPDMSFSPPKLKLKEPDLSWKFRTGAGVKDIWEVAPAPCPFLDTNGFAK